MRNYYPEPEGSSDSGLHSEPASGLGSKSNWGEDDITDRQSGPPSEDGSDKGPAKTKEKPDEGIFENAMPQQDNNADDSVNIDGYRQPNEEKNNEGGLEYKTKTEPDDVGGNDMGEKVAVVGEGSQVNSNEQTKNQMEKQNRGTAINDAKGSWASRVNTNELPVDNEDNYNHNEGNNNKDEKNNNNDINNNNNNKGNDENGSWASRVNTSELPVEVFLLFAQHKNASSEHVLTLPSKE